jgi:hypothetical protein
MPLLNRIVIVVVLLAVAAFCAFGFLATFEQTGSIGLRIGYAVLGTLCFCVAAWALSRKQQDA